MITDATLQKFQQVIQDELDVLLDDKQAKEILHGMVGFYDLLAKINHREKFPQSK